MLSDSDEELEAVFRLIQKKDDYRRYKAPEKRPPRSITENWKVENVPQIQTYRNTLDSHSEAEEINPNRLRTTSIMKDNLSCFSKIKNTKTRLPSRVKRVQRAIEKTSFDKARSYVKANKVKSLPKKQDLSHFTKRTKIKKNTKDISESQNRVKRKEKAKSKERENRQKLSVLELIDISSDDAISEEYSPVSKRDGEKCERVTKKRKLRIPDNKVPIAIDSSTDDENEGESFRKQVMRRRKYQIHA